MVVVKLVNTVLPTRLYLGQKDAQQAVILRPGLKDLTSNWNRSFAPSSVNPTVWP